jgi:TP901 family phage tail tape measure protein
VTVIGEAAVRVRPDTTGFRLETQRGVSSALTGLGGLGSLGSTLRFTGLAAGIGAVAFAAKGSVTAAADLEQTLNVLRVTAGATADEMDRIGQHARELGADLLLPGVSANDAAEAMLQLVKGGVSVEDAIDGARGVLQLGTAANIEFADSANTVARALTTFQLPGKDAVEVADLLVGAAQAATGEVTDMAEALSAGGATAQQFGVSLEDAVTFITLLAQNGILGAEAGTGLRRVLQQLIPTTQEQADLFEKLGVQAFDLGGRLRPLPDIFQDFKDAFAGLTEEAQADVLNKIFGTFGIQAASIGIREGGAAFRELKGDLTAGGQVAEVSTAQTEGLKGSVSNLASQLETLGTTLGTIATPKLTEFTTALAGVVGDANDAANAIREFWDFDPDIIGGISVGDLLGNSAEAKKTLSDLERQLQDVEDARKAATDFSTPQFPLKIEFGAVAALTEGLKKQGAESGKNFVSGLSTGIISKEQEAVNAARDTLAQVVKEGERAVAEAIRQGNEAVRLSAIQARQNLISIGTDLAGQAVQLIDEGPLARRIEQLQASLTQGQDTNQRSRLREALSDAQRELRQAQGSIVTGPGPLTRAGQDAVDEFLDPFERAVRDAKAALGEFNTEGVINELQTQADEQKKVVTKGIADLIVEFNKGTISLQQLSTRTAELLKQNGVDPYGRAGKALGIAFTENFLAQLKGVREQALEIARGIDVAEIGVEPTVVSPAGERARQNTNIAQTQESAAQRTADARASLLRAQHEQARAAEDNTVALKDNTTAVKGLSTLLAPTTTTKKGSDLKQTVPAGVRH